MTPRICVIIPVKNGEKYLKQAIDGILKQHMDVKIIVVDDASTDRTPQIAKELGCMVITHETTKGQVAAKNTGLKQTNQDYVMFHDGDDVMNEGALKTLYDALEKDPSAGAVMGKVRDFISPDITDPASQSAKPKPYYGLFTGAVLIRRNVFDTIGLFDETLHSGEIIEWKNKMDAHHFPIKKVDVVTTNRRIHDHNFGKTHRITEFKDYAQILRQRLRQSN